MIFEVPWDLLKGLGGPILAPGHGRISPKGDFNHPWGGLHWPTSGFSGLFFAYHCRFGPYVPYDHDHPWKSDSMTNHLENFGPKNFLARKARKIQWCLCHEMDIEEHKNSAKHMSIAARL